MGQRGDSTNHKVEGISVFVRVRASDVEDEAENVQQAVEVCEGGTCICVRNAEQPTKSIRCAFDRVYGAESAQEDIFLGLVPALDTVLHGFNACVLAYGQTGSGKTHTLIGPGGGIRLPDNPEKWGIIPRAVQFLFDRLANASEEDETFSYSVTCSFLQIYNENLTDLLQDGAGRGNASLQIREESGRGGGRGSSGQRHKDTGSSGGGNEAGGTYGGHRTGVRPSGLNENRRVFVNGLSSFRVGGAQDVLRYVNIGAINRRVRATQHNEASSRSHAVMQLMVEVESGGGGGGGVDNEHITYRHAKLSLVDLAGSEKMDSALSISKGHFKELRSINQSLSALGNVVSALSEKGRTHVPYRDSKLTRLLQDSLGGNTRTTIIACVDPVARQTKETVNTLLFADRAKKVMVRLRANEVVDESVLLARAQAEIVRLKKLLRQALDNTLTVGGVCGLHEEPGTRDWSSENPKPDINVVDMKEVNDEEHVTPTNSLSGETDAKETAQITTTMVAAQKHQAAKLMAENERLREENDRLKADVQRFSQNNQRSKRRRRGGREVTAMGSEGLPFPPVDWSARYAEAASDTRRRRSAGSLSFVNDSASSLRARSASPLAKVSIQASLSTFKRRSFDDGRDGGEGDPVENSLSAEEVRVVIGDEETMILSPGNQEEAEEVTQLEMFRCELEGGVGGTGKPSKVVENTNLLAIDKTETNKFLHDSQRLEDLMFEAQSRERQRLREERDRFAIAKRERLMLEAQLAELNGGITVATPTAVVTAATSSAPPALSKKIAPTLQQAAPFAEQPPSDGTLLGAQVRSPDARFSKINNDRRGSGWDGPGAGDTFNKAGNTKPPQSRDGIGNVVHSNGRGTVEASLPAGIRKVARVAKLPEWRKTNWTSPAPRQKLNRQRPATSAGAGERARSRRPQGRVGGSRPSGRKIEVAQGFLALQERDSCSQQRDEEQSGLGCAVTAKASGTKVKVLREANPLTSPERSHRSCGVESGDHRGNKSSRFECKVESGPASRTKLVYGVADLGLRLKVYSFRYDHFYECQVIGYDSRRRMHRCAYDATGQKQWHDLANKNFEVVGQNGVVTRSTESAPSKFGGTPSLLVPTSPSSNYANDGGSGR